MTEAVEELQTTLDRLLKGKHIVRVLEAGCGSATHPVRGVMFIALEVKGQRTPLGVQRAPGYSYGINNDLRQIVSEPSGPSV